MFLNHPQMSHYTSVLLSMPDLVPSQGLQAIGVASNWRVTQRAARLMLAATILANRNPGWGHIRNLYPTAPPLQSGVPDPTADGCFQHLVIAVAFMAR